MKNAFRVLTVLGCLLVSLATAQAADVGVSLNVNVGPVGVAFVDPPDFIAPASLGFYVAVGVPYDLFFMDYNYYLCRGGVWYVSSGYNGPWVVIRYNRLPRRLRAHRFEEIIRIRDVEYGHFQHDRSHYRGKYYRPQRHERHEERGREDHGGSRGRGNEGHGGHGGR